MYLVIPWLTHGYALHLKINTPGSFSPVSAIFLPMAGEKYLSARGKANPPSAKYSTRAKYLHPVWCFVMLLDQYALAPYSYKLFGASQHVSNTHPC